MTGVGFTPNARRGLRDLLEYVERDFGSLVAGRVLDKINASLEGIVRNPGIGHRRDDLTGAAGVRFWSIGPALIAYRAIVDSIEILVIERAERDWTGLIDDG